MGIGARTSTHTPAAFDLFTRQQAQTIHPSQVTRVAERLRKEYALAELQGLNPSTVVRAESRSFDSYLDYTKRLQTAPISHLVAEITSVLKFELPLTTASQTIAEKHRVYLSAIVSARKQLVAELRTSQNRAVALHAKLSSSVLEYPEHQLTRATYDNAKEPHHYDFSETLDLSQVIEDFNLESTSAQWTPNFFTVQFADEGNQYLRARMRYTPFRGERNPLMIVSILLTFAVDVVQSAKPICVEL
ncbi:hypothetical protein HDU96_003902, partial [Phlyctochytrium bullatum]